VGKIFVDVDLQSADLLVVIWEADDEALKLAVREGLDLHLCNARDLFNLPYSIDDLRDPSLVVRIKDKYGKERQFTKVFVHATDYGGKSRTVAKAVGLPVREVEQRQRMWFHKHPGIVEWHRRTQQSLEDSRSVANKFGFRVIFFDHVESLLPEALAWVPQSTVALTIDHGAVNLYENRRSDVELLLQVHDSLDFQVANNFTDWVGLRKELSITIPYDDPLVIPVGFKVSDKSWGDCKDLSSYGTSLSALA
jgi:DNA polymerase I-like protein with 3'-5' exonuclease and polymerase domains